MGDDTRFCGRPVRTLTLWFTLFDILIGVIGLAIMPIFIQERSQIYIGYAGLALAYYLFSIIFASIGFYGAYRIKRCHLTTLVVWLCFSFIFFFASYIAAIVTVRSTCDKMWIEESEVDECVQIGEPVLIVAFFIVLIIRYIYTRVAWKLMMAVKAVKKQKSFREAGSFNKKRELLMMQESAVDLKGKNSPP
ncbi:hypothetical protein AAMO2058_001633300 [Amorphochlora amoebiformis]|uniref:MARVEL domain-containing protein n=1 Tax=Amorphochlora amoebiformis TaxID=1561963 RepID=A0A7S0CX51_9EUKA|mmetsp:Transcript_15393/g.24377  ORF Transcript_15393/g.24377 Transcript_15393/m.24377 type:complete len:192 (+) Transcript_15393:47-622(+)